MITFTTNEFLMAEWNHLLLANYSVESSTLEKFVPNKTMMDSFDGKTFISLVAFMFNKTKCKAKFVLILEFKMYTSK